MIRVFIAAILLLPPIQAALADLDDRPLAVLRVEQALGLVAVDTRVAVTGAVFALRAPDGAGSAQIAFDGKGRPVLARLVQAADRSNATHGLVQATVAVAELFGIPRKTLETALTDEAIGLMSSKSEDDRSRPLPNGAVLSYLAAPDVLIVDLPISASPSRRLGPGDVEILISDASFILQRESGALFRYHAPDRRFAEGPDVGDTGATGSWRVDDDGAYCLERAPIEGFHCAALHTSGERIHVVPLSADGAPDAEDLTEVVVVHGNPGDLRVARRADSTPPQVTRMLTRGRSEERALPDGARTRLHMSKDGAFRGLSADGASVSGTWSVLADGRRCLGYGPDNFECAFLSETDGGTYRLFDAEGQLLGEALLSDGNPFGF